MGGPALSVVIEWIVYYSDGSSFTSADGSPSDAPRRGVQCVAVRDDTCGKLIWHSSDFYCWQGEWVNHSLLGLLDYLELGGTEKIVLRGFGIARDRFKAVYRSAVEDPRLPFKTCRHPDEPEPPV
jgi:hypothetical protein